MPIDRLNALLDEAARTRGLDWRQCYRAVIVEPPGGRRVRVECSDAAVLAAARQAHRARPDDPEVTFVALPDAGADLAAPMVAASSVADVRREPAHASELLSQIVYGDAVTPLKDEGEWVLARLDDGYVGWIRTWHLVRRSAGELADFLARSRQRVALNHAEALEAPDPDALPVSDLVIGTRLVTRGCGKRGWRAVELPDGKTGFVRSRALEPVPRRRSPRREGLAATGLRFLGVPYIWGGTTPKGFDCSGLIQRIFRLHGVLLPRDSDQQAGFGRLVEGGLDAMETGHLLFFGKEAITHVGMALPDGLFLHAHGQVKVGSLDLRHRLFEPDLRRIWRLTRDPLAAAGGP